MAGTPASITIRPALLEDAPAIGALIDAMDTHYRGIGGGSGRAASQAVAARAIEEHEGTRFLLAFAGDAPVGIACFAVIRPGRRLAGLVFLKDLFVLASHRGQGIGVRLMRALAGYARCNGIGRIDLTTDAGNDGAMRLYSALGGERLDKVMFTFEGCALAALAGDEAATTK